MKRIFSIFLCAVIITALFVVPMSVSAVQDDGTILGTWVFNDTLKIDGTKVSAHVNFTANGEEFIILAFEHFTGTSYNYKKLSMYRPNYGTTEEPYNTKNNPKWTGDTYKTITITGGSDITSETFILWLNANAVKTHNIDGSVITNECDGSTCPATDPNEDNICDDCGLPFVWSLRNDTYNFNGVSLPINFGGTAGITNDLYTLFDASQSYGGNIFIIDGDTEQPKLYVFTPSAVVNNGNIVTSQAGTEVVLYTVATDENGTLY